MGMIYLSSALIGLAVAFVANWLITMAQGTRDDTPYTATERERRYQMRARSKTYRWFEPVIDELAPWCERTFRRSAEVLRHNLPLVQPDSPWKPGEYLAIKAFESVILGVAGGVFGYALLGVDVGIFFGVLTYVVSCILSVRGVAQQAKRRLARLRSRLPFTVDLMALMLESGSLFREALTKAAEENRGHPLGEELQRVRASQRRGNSQAEALREMARRLDDSDINELVFSINTAEERGGKLKDTLRDMAEQIRSRRVHWLERAAEEAKVQITFPGMVVMIACLFIVAAPFILAGMGK